MDTAQVILLLVSPDFIDSDYCYGVEMKKALERHAHGDATVIPVILRHVYWGGTPFSKLQALPTDARPVVDRFWNNPDEAFFDVAEGIRNVVETHIASRAKAEEARLRQLNEKVARQAEAKRPRTLGELAEQAAAATRQREEDRARKKRYS